MSKDINDPHPYEQPLLTLALILVCVLLIQTQAAKRLDLMAYDAAIQMLPTPLEDSVVIVAVDEKSLNGIGQWPWRRAIHAQLIDKLSRFNASLIAFDIIFSEQDTAHPEDDEILAESIRSNGNVILPMHIHPLSYGSSMSEILPIPPLVNAAKRLGHVHVELDEDGLARGIYLNSGIGDDHWPSLSMAMAMETNPMIRYQKTAEDLIKAPYMSVKTEYRLIPFAGQRGSYPAYSYLDVMADKIPAETFRDKIVLIGASAVGLGDIIPTPITTQNTPLSGVEFHANAYASIMNDSAIRSVGTVWSYLLTFALIMIPILIFPRLSPTFVMPSTALLTLACAGFSYALLKIDHTWFAPMNAIIGILLAYPLWSWQRMRHLNRFFSEELKRLTQEPDLGFRRLGQHSVEKIFLSLLALLKPSHYVLKQNNQVLHCLGQEFFDELKTADDEQWHHDEHTSSLFIKDRNTHYQLSLRWDHSSQRNQIKNFLDKLDLKLQRGANTKRYYEQISNRIVQVREAITSMQDMRTFISKGFEEMPGAVIVTDPVGLIIYCNSRANEWLNDTESPLIGQTIHHIISNNVDDSETLEQQIVSVLLETKECEFEALVNERDTLIHCIPFVVDEHSDAGMMVSLSDITPIRAQQREKNQLIDFLSHDVRSPLVSQLALLHGLRNGRIEWHSGLIDDIERHAKRSLNLSEQFLQMTRAEQINEGEFYEFDLLSAVENAIDSVNHLACEKKISIHLHTQQDAWLQGNAELMERAVINLLSNAIKYSDSDTRVDISLELKDSRAYLKISDQGHGISKEELPHIFDRFRRQKSSEVTGEKGAGLGLNFVKVVVDKHQGKLEVESEFGQGTTFTLVFPSLSESDITETNAE